MSADINATNEIKEEFENADDSLSKHQYNNNNTNNENMQDSKDFFDNDNVSEHNNSGQDSPKFIRLRGLPWSATHQEILDFLKDVSVVNGAKGIHLVTSRWDGKNTGEAYVEVETQQDVEEARKLNKALMEHRYIEVFTANSKEARDAMRKTGSHGGSYVVKLRGLPYAVTEQQIEEFFNGLEIKPDREGILFVMDRRGRATGEAFVQFESQDDTEQALGRNRDKIGHRYIEIFRSSLAELKRASTGNGRPVPYDIKDRGANRGNFNDFNNGSRSNSRDGWNNGNFNVGANNTLGFNNLPHFTNSGNFGNSFGHKNSNIPNNGGIFGNINNNNNNSNSNGSGGGGGAANNGNFGNFTNFANSGNFGHGGMNNGGGNNNNNINNTNGGNNQNNFGNFNNNNSNINLSSSRPPAGGVGMPGNGNNNNNNNNASGFSGNNRFNNGNGNFGNDFGDFNNFGNQRNFNGNNFGSNMNDFVLNRNNGNNNNNNNNNFGNNNNNFSNFGNDNIPSNSGNFNNGGPNVCNFGPVGGGRGEFFTIHMRGLPYSCFENDVFKFFDPIRPVNVRINFNKKGLHSGTADVFFEAYEDAQLAMKRHREQMGSRYIELFFDGKTKGPQNNNNNNNHNNNNNNNNINNNAVACNKNTLHGNNAGNNFSRRI